MEAVVNLDSLRAMYKTELQETWSVEAQLTEALPKMANAAQDPQLKKAFEMHLEQTREHQRMLENLLQGHNVQPREHTDQSMQAMIREAEKWAGIVKEPKFRDAGLIASAQRIEHYEIAIYGTLATWAKQLGLDEEMRKLLSILEQEKEADDKLTSLAKASVNPTAAAA
jgi:ferritin-like metal-binding protein YciE